MTATATTTQLGLLSKDDIAALKDSAKNGSGVVFRMPSAPKDAEIDYNYVFASTIELSKRGDGRYTGDLNYDISVESHVTDYSHDHGYNDRANIATLNAFHMLHSPSVDEKWQTVVAFLHEGDEVSLKWIRGNCSQWTKEREIAIDELSIEVYRRAKNGVGKARRYTFLMGYTVTREGLGRMVRSPIEMNRY